MYLIHNAKYKSSKVGRIQQGVNHNNYVISRDFRLPAYSSARYPE